ncbi:hypothetical protein BVI434_850098 [Burkholderia vietnamiensis]|nr:hypothetical protein BVI434_850098 [Burkholderia vietnamiensis]
MARNRLACDQKFSNPETKNSMPVMNPGAGRDVVFRPDWAGNSR